jgi:glutaredoxin
MDNENEWLVFSTLQCPWCVESKKALRSAGIKYREIEVNSREKFLMLQEHSPMTKTVPVIVNGDTKEVYIGHPALVKYLAERNQSIINK